MTRGEKSLLATSLLLVVLALGGTTVWQRSNTAPITSIPVRPLPSPNAYDFYSRAGKAAIEGNPLTGASSAARPGTPPAPLPARLALVHSNQLAFDLLHQGFAYPCAPPSPRSILGVAVVFPKVARLRSLARVLSFSARVRADQGNYPAAWGYGLDSIRMGSDLSRSGPLLSTLIGIAIETIGRQPLWGYVDKLSAADTRACAHRLETIEAKRAPFAETVREEKFSGQTILSDILKTDLFSVVPAPALFGAGGGTAPGFAVRVKDFSQAMRLRAQLVRKGKRGIYDDYTHYMDRQIAVTSVPYTTLPAEPAVPTDPINESFALSGIRQTYFKDSANRMENQLLLAALALHAYQLERHDYPTALSDLVTQGYLSHIPTDPFAPESGTPLRYRYISRHTFLLYSLGADGKNDNGIPVPQKSNRSLKADQKGDFVYGVSTYPR